jgi:hypothetical protein
MFYDNVVLNDRYYHTNSSLKHFFSLFFVVAIICWQLFLNNAYVLRYVFVLYLIHLKIRYNLPIFSMFVS